MLRGVVAAARARPLALAAVAAALVSCALWFSAGPPAPGAGALVPLRNAEPAPDAQPDAQPDARGDVRRGRCASCGFVVGIRELQPTGFEFTVRLRDGSMRISKAASRGTWHIGDPVMLMGDAAASVQ